MTDFESFIHRGSTHQGNLNLKFCMENNFWLFLSKMIHCGLLDFISSLNFMEIFLA